jgi:hypothetical protein
VKRSLHDWLPEHALPEHALAVCGQCGDTIWLYATPNGGHVALDNLPGPYVIEGTKAHRSTHGDGYRGHWDHCKRATSSQPFSQIVDDDFLWR